MSSNSASSSSMSSTQKTFLFAIVMCLACGVLLTAASEGLKSRQERNIQVDKQKNILKALGLLDSSAKYSADDISVLYRQKVQAYQLDVDGNIVAYEGPSAERPIYVVGSKDNVQKYAIPFKAYGLWSWIYGYLALDNDGQTVVGFTVYNHGETPGLGGEVAAPWFQNQFVGKKITDLSGHFVSVGVAKGKVDVAVPESKRPNYVDGMSGATLTGNGVTKYLALRLKEYESFSSKFRETEKPEQVENIKQTENTEGSVQ